MGSKYGIVLFKASNMKTLKSSFQNIAAKLFILLILTAFLALFSSPALALVTDPNGLPGTTSTPAPTTPIADPNCSDSSDVGVRKCLKNNQIVKDLNLVVNFLSAGVGIIVIGVIILGGIQYSLAGDNATATGVAKKRITDGLIALAAFIFAFAFLQWLIPGGL